MKLTYHIPTEQYGFVEIEKEWNGSDEDAIEGYHALRTPQNATGDGLDPKEYNRCVDEYLATGSLKDGTNLYEKMSPSQQDWFQTTKRALKRIKSKE